MRLAILGAGELGKLIAHHAQTDSGFEVIGFYDDFIIETSFNSFPVLGNSSRILTDFGNGKFDRLFIGIGYSHMNSRAKYLSTFKGKIPFANIIHSSSYIDASCKLGEGIFILPRVTLDFGVEIRDNVLINTG